MRSVTSFEEASGGAVKRQAQQSQCSSIRIENSIEVGVENRLTEFAKAIRMPSRQIGLDFSRMSHKSFR
jgi:hypothetical protein